MESPDICQKRCSKCGVEKLLSEFRKQKNGRLGVRADCKMCNKLYRLLNKEQIKNSNKNYYQSHKALSWREKCDRLEKENEALRQQLFDLNNADKGDR